MKPDNDSVKHCRVTLVVSNFAGIRGTVGEYDMDDFDPNDEILVDVNLAIPKSLFEPVKVKVEIPENYSHSRVASGTVEEVQIPIDFLAEVSTRKFDDGIVVRGERGLMASFKTIVDKAFERLRTPEEKKKRNEKLNEAERQNRRAELVAELEALDKQP